MHPVYQVLEQQHLEIVVGVERERGKERETTRVYEESWRAWEHRVEGIISCPLLNYTTWCFGNKFETRINLNFSNNFFLPISQPDSIHIPWNRRKFLAIDSVVKRTFYIFPSIKRKKKSRFVAKERKRNTREWWDFELKFLFDFIWFYLVFIWFLFKF